jgi:hypothetical protein
MNAMNTESAEPPTFGYLCCTYRLKLKPEYQMLINDAIMQQDRAAIPIEPLLIANCGPLGIVILKKDASNWVDSEPRNMTDIDISQLWHVYVDTEHWQKEDFPAKFVRYSVSEKKILKTILKQYLPRTEYHNHYIDGGYYENIPLDVDITNARILGMRFD